MAMKVSDTAMSEASTSTASSFDVNNFFDDKSVCQVCFVKGNKPVMISYVPSPLIHILSQFNYVNYIIYISKLQNVKRGMSITGLYAVMDAEHFFEGLIRHQDQLSSHAKA